MTNEELIEKMRQAKTRRKEMEKFYRKQKMRNDITEFLNKDKNNE